MAIDIQLTGLFTAYTDTISQFDLGGSFAYESGTDPDFPAVGSKITGTSGSIIMNGVELFVGAKVIISKQTNPVQNGYYLVTTVPVGRSSTYVFERIDCLNSTMNRKYRQYIINHSGCNEYGNRYAVDNNSDFINSELGSTAAINFKLLSNKLVYKAWLSDSFGIEVLVVQNELGFTPVWTAESGFGGDYYQAAPEAGFAFLPHTEIIPPVCNNNPSAALWQVYGGAFDGTNCYLTTGTQDTATGQIVQATGQLSGQGYSMVTIISYLKFD